MSTMVWMRVALRMTVPFGLSFYFLFLGCLSPCTSSTLELVQILFRHGDRTPINPFPKDAYRNYWKEGYGQLTNVGKRQHYALGQYFRDRYKDFLNETYNLDDILVNSTNVDRTLMSATVHLAGLYPPVGQELWDKDLHWQPIPVHTKEKAVDYVLDTDSDCPKYRRLFKEIQNSPEMKQLNEENRDLYSLVSNNTGRDVTDIFTMNDIHDTLFIERVNNLTIPGWADAVYNQMRNLSQLSFTWKFKTPEVRRLRGGPMVGHMIDNMNLKINGTNTKRKAYLFSAHDTTVAAFLSSLNVFNGISPPYACAVIVELHRLDDGRYGVQILFRNSTVGDPVVLTLPNCTAPCPLVQFLNLTRAVVPLDIVSECEASGNVWRDFPWAVAGLVLSLTLLFILILGSGIFCWKRRQVVDYRYMMVQNE